jgi:hypothetical protein
VIVCSDPNFFRVVLDIHIVLDAFVFDDPAARPLKSARAALKLEWIATESSLTWRWCTRPCY